MYVFTFYCLWSILRLYYILYKTYALDYLHLMELDVLHSEINFVCTKKIVEYFYQRYSWPLSPYGIIKVDSKSS